MTDAENRPTTVPADVERDGFVWNLVERGDGTWGEMVDTEAMDLAELNDRAPQGARSHS